METTLLSTLTDKLFDPIRKRWVAATPEERIRQRLLQLLLSKNIPPHQILVEVRLRDLPLHSLPQTSLRSDVIVLQVVSGSPKVLLLAECKAYDPDEQACRQILTYQPYCQARYLLLAGPSQLWHCDTLSEERSWIPSFPF